jgi:nitrogen regulatory protein PII 2
VSATRDALVELGFPAMNVLPVLGRGKHHGIAGELGYQIPPEDLPQDVPGMTYVPKRLVSLVVPDASVDSVVETIVEVNATDHIGDGRVFVCPVDEAVRVRTGETGTAAIS